MNDVNTVPRGHLGKAHPTPYQKQKLRQFTFIVKDIKNIAFYIFARRNNIPMKLGQEYICERWLDELYAASEDARKIIKDCMRGNSNDEYVFGSKSCLGTPFMQHPRVRGIMDSWTVRSILPDFYSAVLAYRKRLGTPNFQYWNDPPFTIPGRMKHIDGANNDANSATWILKHVHDTLWHLRIPFIGIDPDDPRSIEFIKVRLGKPPRTLITSGKCGLRFHGDWKTGRGMWYFNVQADCIAKPAFTSTLKKQRSAKIGFNPLDPGLCKLNGKYINLEELNKAFVITKHIAIEKSYLDIQYPYELKDSRTQEQWDDFNKGKDKLRDTWAKLARIRTDALHKWTANIVEEFGTIHVHRFKIKQATRTSKGNKFDWGTLVRSKAALNQYVLNKCIYKAVLMLEYKAKEADVDYTHEVSEIDKNGQIVAVNEAVNVAKKSRRVKREILKQSSRNSH